MVITKEKLEELARLQEAAKSEKTTLAICAYRRALLRDGDAILEYVREAERERDESRKENDFMRLRLAESDKACVYCDLPKAEMGACAHGFPGCARANDLFHCDELTNRDARMKREGAAEWLEAFLSKVRSERPHGLTISMVQLEAEAKRLQEGK